MSMLSFPKSFPFPFYVFLGWMNFALCASCTRFDCFKGTKYVLVWSRYVCPSTRVLVHLLVVVWCYFICVKAQNAIINILGQLVNQPGQALWRALLLSELLDGPMCLWD